MKLAEALALRAGAARRAEQLRARIVASARLRGQADDLARQLREIDTLIQRTNWEADLLD
ncbi:hypothetical protein ACN27F_19695 [Solwaraspora sp. WMMB335]|uniref:DIP1984 family protein n=1 Tax=Solwaraspora sp. WMMB335 TaxID=3404118 RepID=UPI003B938363